MEKVNNIYNNVLEIAKGRDSIKRNRIIRTDTLNTFCEIQAFSRFSTVLSVLWDTLYIMLFH